MTRIDFYSTLARALYRILTKAAKTKAIVSIGQILAETDEMEKWLSQMLHLGSQIDSNQFENPSILLPALSETLFVLVKLLECIILMQIKLDSQVDLSKRCKKIIILCASIGEFLLKTALSLVVSAGTECFKDQVNQG